MKMASDSVEALKKQFLQKAMDDPDTEMSLEQAMEYSQKLSAYDTPSVHG